MQTVAASLLRKRRPSVWAKGDLTSVRAHYAVLVYSPTCAPVVIMCAFNMRRDDHVKPGR